MIYDVAGLEFGRQNFLDVGFAGDASIGSSSTKGAAVVRRPATKMIVFR